jgi:uncharacterized repeat protein (TIGR04138 family)
MNRETDALLTAVRADGRYSVAAYLFVREALAYAADNQAVEELATEEGEPARKTKHVTGQQLCEGIRQFALNQYGYMSRLVLNSWGLNSTTDFGNVVYNMITVGILKKSANDRRKHFDNVFDFEEVFEKQFRLCHPLTSHRCSGSETEFASECPDAG